MATALLPGVPGWVARERLAALAAQEAAAAGEANTGEAEDPDPRCLGETASGERCLAFRLKGSLFCRHHDPDARAGDDAAREERARQREARAATRRAEVWAARLQTREQLAAFVAGITRAAWDRRLDPETAAACLDGARLLAGLLRPRRRRGRRDHPRYQEGDGGASRAEDQAGRP